MPKSDVAILIVLALAASVLAPMKSRGTESGHYLRPAGEARLLAQK